MFGRERHLKKKLGDHEAHKGMKKKITDDNFVQKKVLEAPFPIRLALIAELNCKIVVENSSKYTASPVGKISTSDTR